MGVQAAKWETSFMFLMLIVSLHAERVQLCDTGYWIMHEIHLGHVKAQQEKV